MKLRDWIILFGAGGLGGYILYRRYKKQFDQILEPIQDIQDMLQVFLNIPKKIENKAIKALEKWEEPKSYSDILLKNLRLNFSPYDYMEADHFSKNTGAYFLIPVPKNLYTLYKDNLKQYKLNSSTIKKQFKNSLDLDIYIFDQKYKLHLLSIPIIGSFHNKPEFIKKEDVYYIKVGGNWHTPIVFQSYNFFRIFNNARKVSKCEVTEEFMEEIAEAIKEAINSDEINDMYSELISDINRNKFPNCHRSFPIVSHILKRVISGHKMLLYLPTTLNKIKVPEWVDTDVIGNWSNESESFNYLIDMIIIKKVKKLKNEIKNLTKIDLIPQNESWKTNDPEKVMKTVLSGSYLKGIEKSIAQSVNLYSDEMKKLIKG